MIRKNLNKILIILSIVLLNPITLYAYNLDLKDKTYVSSYGGIHTFSEDRAKDCTSLGGKAGYFIYDNISLEASFGILNLSSYSCLSSSASAYYHLLFNERVLFFIGSGVYADNSNSYVNPILGLNFGAGIKTIVYSNIMARFEINQIGLSNKEYGISVDIFDTVYSLGLEYYFADLLNITSQSTKKTPKKYKSFSTKQIENSEYPKAIDLPIKFPKGDFPSTPKQKNFYSFYKKDYTSLREIALKLKKQPNLSLELHSLSNIKGSYKLKYNKASKQGTAIKNYLSKKFAIKSKRIKVVPYASKASTQKIGWIKYGKVKAILTEN